MYISRYLKKIKKTISLIGNPLCIEKGVISLSLHKATLLCQSGNRPAARAHAHTRKKWQRERARLRPLAPSRQGSRAARQGPGKEARSGAACTADVRTV